MQLQKVFVTEVCLVYHTRSTERTIVHGSRSISSPDVWNFYYQRSSVTSYHGSTMSAITIRCQTSFYREHWMEVVAELDHVNPGGATSKMDIPVIVVLAVHRRRQKSMGDHQNRGVCRRTHNDAWASPELVS